jgi:hypothetical protein
VISSGLKSSMLAYVRVVKPGSSTTAASRLRASKISQRL